MKIIPSSRRRHYAARVSIFLVTVALVVGMVDCGDTTQNPEIRDWYDLASTSNNLSGSYILMNDLNSTTAGYIELASETANEGKGWQPIGNYDNPFTGRFDGQGYEICDLFINRPDEWYVGLFGVVGEGGVVQNIGVVNADVTGYRKVGGLVGWNYGTVSDCYSTGNVTGNQFVGGLVGENDDTVKDSYSSGNVTGDDGVGGLVGWNAGTVSYCYSTGSVTGNRVVGGLVGQNAYGGTVSDCYSTGSVTGDEYVGGLVGRNRVFGGAFEQSIVSNSYYNYDEVLINGENIITIGALFNEDFDEWLANDKFLDINDRLSQENGYYVVNNIADFKELLAFGQDNSLKFRLKNDFDLATEPNFYIPYFAGEFDGNGHKISNLSFDFDFISDVGLFGCLASGGKVTDLGVENVNITGADLVGGLVGLNWEGTVSVCYSTGSVTGSVWVGGLVGRIWRGTVSDSYSTGSVSGNWSAGGLVGHSNFSTVNNSYSTGSVTGVEHVGGLVGWNRGGNVGNSYATGTVTGDSYVGGLVGWNEEGTVSDSFWDTETSGQATSAGGTGKNTTEMWDIATFTDTETEGLDEPWDITTVANPGTRNPSYTWNTVDDETYPFLSWEP